MAITTRWRPPRISLQHPNAEEDLDLGLRVLYDNAYGLEQSSLQNVVSGQRQANGNVQVTGVSKNIVTGLTSVVNVQATIVTDGTPMNDVVSIRPTPALPGAVDIFVYAPGVVLSTTKRLVHWFAAGT